MARYRSRDNTAIRKKIVAPRNIVIKACTKQATREIVCLPNKKMTSNLGMIALVREDSRKEKRLRKKYMGVWR
jgi:hypothetical protein